MDYEEEPALGVSLETPHNAEVALSWAQKYGVLGLGTNPNESLGVSGALGSTSADIAARKLGKPELGHDGTRAGQMSPRGGKHETVEDFVFEAFEARVVLKLYEAASVKPDSEDAKRRSLETISGFMSDEMNFHHYPKHIRNVAKSERVRWGRDEELARSWALNVVENAVHRKVEHDVYPILVGESGSYTEGWGFKSLLGAMWFQMRVFMLGDRNYTTCLNCGGVFYKSRRNRDYCDEDCGRRARQKRAYREQKQRQQEAREETRRRLRQT